MMNTKLKVWLVTVGVVVLGSTTVGILINKSNDSKGSFVTPSHTVSAVPPAPIEPIKYYASKQLADTLDAGGFACKDFKTIPNAINSSIDMGSCVDGDVVISIFATAEATQLAPTDLYTTINGLQPIYVVIGPNWMINCGEMCAQIADITHGEHIMIEATP